MQTDDLYEPKRHEVNVMKIGVRNSVCRQLIIIVGGAFLFVVTSLSAQANNPLTIGQITSLTGRDAVAGVDVKRGVALALKRINNGYEVPMVDGGTKKTSPGLLDGRELRVLVEDTESRPSSAMDATRKLVNVDRRAGSYWNLFVARYRGDGSVYKLQPRYPDRYRRELAETGGRWPLLVQHYRYRSYYGEKAC